MSYHDYMMSIPHVVSFDISFSLKNKWGF